MTDICVFTMATIKEILAYLLDEANDVSEEDNHSHGHHHDNHHHHHHHHHHRHIKDQLDNLEPSSHLRLLQQLLCIRQPDPALPEDILDGIESVLQKQMSRRVLTPAGSIQPTATLRRDNSRDIRPSLWQGDITTLAGLTALTNAANSQGLGCFQPPHRCIDNVIHSWAGPRLRDECNQAMQSRGGRELEPGDAITTQGHCLAAGHIVHTVGPQLVRRGGAAAVATPLQTRQLERCYRAVLDAAEALPATPDGRKIVTLCGISTGLFAFPAREAAPVAVGAVAGWFEEHEGTSVTDVLFNTFTGADHAIYTDILASALQERRTGWSPAPLSNVKHPPLVQCDSLDRARVWLKDADAVLVSAGAGLSASDGLDYTSAALFSRPFQEGEKRWRRFRRDAVLSGEKTTVILELGAGMSTPGVLRCPNEDLVNRGRGRVKLVRVGLGPEAAVPWDLDEAKLATSIDGDISAVVRELLGQEPGLEPGEPQEPIV